MVKANLDTIRKSLIRTVKTAQRSLGLNDETYRNMLADNFGVESSTQLSITQLEELLTIFRRRGFAPKVMTDGQGRRRMSQKSSNKPAEDKTQGDKIRAEWIAGAREGAIRDGSEQALQRMIKRVTGLVAGPETLWPSQASKVIEAIKAIRKRHLSKEVQGEY